MPTRPPSPIINLIDPATTVQENLYQPRMRTLDIANQTFSGTKAVFYKNMSERKSHKAMTTLSIENFGPAPKRMKV